MTLGAAKGEAQDPDRSPGSLDVAPSAGPPPVPNLVEFPTRCLVITTDRTVNGDAEAISATVQNATIIENCNSWQDADYRIACICYEEEPYDAVLISGHGSIDGGVKASNENLISSNISDQFIESLSTILTPEGQIFILGCGQGVRWEEMQAFADQTGYPVTANTGCTFGGNKGNGEWVTFYPLSWQWKRGGLIAELYNEDRLVQ